MATKRRTGNKQTSTKNESMLHFDDPVAFVYYQLTIQKLNEKCTAIEKSVKDGERISIAKELSPILDSQEMKYLKLNMKEGYETLSSFIDVFTKAFTEKQKELTKKLKPMPTGAMINLSIDAINACQNGQLGLDALPELKRKISHTKYSVTHGSKFSKAKATTIRHDLSEDRGYVAIQIPDAITGKLTGYSVAVKKFFALVLEKINEQAYQDGQLTRDYIEFPISEVVERGIYGSYQSAQRGLKEAMSCLTNIKIEGELTFGKKGSISYSRAYGIAVLFPTVGYKKGQCRLYLNGQADWRFVMQAFSILPKYYYALPNRPSELLHFIFSTARQHTQDIAKRGHFNISFRAIQQALNLPDEDKTKNPQRDIKEKIFSAVDEIEKAHREDFGNDEDLFFLSPEYNDSWPIARFLNEGYLQVNLSGIFAQPFIDVESEKIKGLREAKRKQQKALEAKKEQ